MAQVIDPVCKMVVDSTSAKFSSDYLGTTYYFCAPGCKRAFEKAPEKYLNETVADQDHTGHNH